MISRNMLNVCFCMSFDSNWNTFLDDPLKYHQKKIQHGYERAIEKRVEQMRSHAGSMKLVTCRHFNLLSFLHSTVTSQGTDTNVDTGFAKIKLILKMVLVKILKQQEIHVVQLILVMLLKHVKPNIKTKEKVRIPLMFNEEKCWILWMILSRQLLKIKIL